MTGAGNLNFFYILTSICSFLLLFPTQGRAESKFSVNAGSSVIDATITTNSLKVSDSQLKAWVQRAADAVVAYYGRYPVAHVTLQIRPFDGRGVRGGQTFAMHGGLIRIAVGTDTIEAG